MTPNPSDGCLVPLSDEKYSASSFLCIFDDETNEQNKKFHINLDGKITVRELYKTVGEKLFYQSDSFLLCYMEYGEYGVRIVLEEDKYEKTLQELLQSIETKKKMFYINNKNENDPISVKEDDPITTIPVQATDESYSVGTLFPTNENSGIDVNSASVISTSLSYNSYASAVSNTKSATGYVGLVNQAMTCYLNSLIQTLFMTPEFRNALYRLRIKRNGKDEILSIPYQLQKLFLKLETSSQRAVETTGLTKSFGWESGEAWQQHDVQELCRVMFDKLEETLKGTDQEDLINQLYQGEMKDYVKCLKCGHENSRKDNFLDISVDIKPFGSDDPYENLGEALKAFVTPETLSGNNQYYCEKCKSKQDAHKGLKFISFPYLLTIQLKRFTFDFNTLQRTKLPDKLTFPFEVNLNELIEKEDTSENVVDEKNKSNNNEIANDRKPSCDDTNNKNSFQNEISKGPYIYELFSVLIHSGSAVGGHYYAYIKSFENDKWYCFNDQYVSEISKDDILKSYGGNRVGLVSSSYSSSTNAYMLMYRRKDEKKNIGFFHQSRWSKSLQDLCKDILDDENREHNRKEWEKNVCKLNLYAFHPVTKIKLDSKLEVHKDATLKEATEIAWKKLELEEVIPLEQCRLVKYDDHNESFLKSFEDSEEKPMIDILGSVRQLYGFDLLLECCEKNEEFKVYQPGGATLKLYIVDSEERDFEGPKNIHVPLTTTLAELKEMFETETGIPACRMKVAVHKEYLGFNLLEKESRSLKSEGFYKSAKIFVNALPDDDGEANLDFKETKFFKRLDIFANSINLKVTCPVDNKEEGETTEKSMFVDKRITLKDFKSLVSKQIKMESGDFRVFRTYSNNQEIECNRLEDQLVAYANDAKIIIKRGRALKTGETRIKIFQLLVNEKEYFKFFMDAIVSKEVSILKLKEESIYPHLKKEGIQYEPSRVRLRKKQYKNPTLIYCDELIFENDITVGLSTELYMEILPYENEVTTQEHLSVYVRWWHPEQTSIDPFEEVVLFKEFTIDNLKKQISKKSGIPEQYISIAKGKGMFPCVSSVLDIHHDLDWDLNCKDLRDYPLSIKEDGSVIYFRDSRAEVKKLTNDEIRELRNKERDSSSTNQAKSYRKEKALKIYTNGEKR